MMNKCVFLDRDGTINYDYGYTYLIEDLVILPDVLDALKIIKKRGFLLIVITNQSGIARGKYSKRDVEIFNKTINEFLLQKGGFVIDDFYYCPHHVEGIIEPYNCKCKCRKPNPLLIFEAANKYNIDLSKSYIIGNTESDMLLGLNAGLKGAFKVTDNITMMDYIDRIV